MIFRALAAFLLSASALAAQPLTIVTSSGPGSLSDTSVRFVAPLLERELGRPVVVQNITGGNGVVGMRAYMAMAADGTALFVGGTQVPYLSATHPQKDFDPMVDLEPLHGLVYTPQQVLVPAGSPVKSVADLKALQLAKGSLNGGSSHPSTETSMRLLDKVTGASTTVVSYKQTAQLASDLAAGFIDYTIGGKGNGATAGFLAAGQLRVAGMLADLRVEEFSWTGFYIHAKAPKDVKRHLTFAIERVMQSREAARYHQPLFLADGLALRRLAARELRIIQSQ